MGKQRPFDTRIGGSTESILRFVGICNFSSSMHVIRLNNPFKVQRVAVWKEQPHLSDSQIR